MKAPIFSAYAPSMYDARRIIDKMATCRRCSGSGISNRNAAADCQACNGTGKRQDAPSTTASADKPLTTRKEVTAAERKRQNNSEAAKQGWRMRRERAAEAAEPICRYTGLPMKHCLCGLDGCSNLKANA